MTTFKAPPGESSPRTKPINENPNHTLGPNTKGRWMLAKNSVLLQSELFAGLDQATVEQFTAMAELRSFAADEKIVAEGQKASFVYCVMNGFVRLSKSESTGREADICVCEPGDTFGEYLLSGAAPTLIARGPPTGPRSRCSRLRTCRHSPTNIRSYTGMSCASWSGTCSVRWIVLRETDCSQPRNGWQTTL